MTYDIMYRLFNLQHLPRILLELLSESNFGLVAVLYKMKQTVNTHYAIYVNTISQAETYTITITSPQPFRATTSHESL